MKIQNTQERVLNPFNGIAMLIMLFLGLILSIVAPILAIARGIGSTAIQVSILVISVIAFIVFCIMFAGLKSVRPNEALVLTLFGKYYGTIKQPGYFYVNPFCAAIIPEGEAEKVTTSKKSKENISFDISKVKKTISLKTMTWSNGTQKVNDVLGNPIIIGAVVFWRVENPTAAVFNVDNYSEYLSTQTDSTIRNIARLYPYDILDVEGGESEQTLRGSSQEIAQRMQQELQDRVSDAGLVVEDVRITHLSYSEEIAAAMLQRQQASAIIAARHKIVDGAVGMVKMAIDKLNDDEIVVLDEERKAQMVSNLLVVLCGNKEAQPIVNSGSIY